MTSPDPTPSSDPARDLIAVDSLAEVRRRVRPATPAALGRRLMGERYRTTPAVAMISQAFADTANEPDGRLIISIPPREAKSTTVAVLGTVHTLAANPNTEVILASYADGLAQEHSANARALIAEHGDTLGVSLAEDRAAVGRWRIAGHRGGLLATGIMAGVTGKGADLLVLDDVVKNSQEADSETHRRRVLHEFRSTLMTRVHPGASVVIIGVRWHPDDLIGTLLAEEPDRWNYISVPAIAETGIPDALHRPVGQAMTSAVGRTPEHFDDLRRSVGSRTWYAEFQGLPASPAGNVIRREWIDQWRIAAVPSAPVRTVIGVDPSDSGEGDAAGIVAASVMPDGVVVVHRDISEPMTPESWARAAVELAIDVGASEIAVESFTAREGYLSVVNTTLGRYRSAHPIRVTSWPPKGDTTGRGRGGRVGTKREAHPGDRDRHGADRRTPRLSRSAGGAVAGQQAPARLLGRPDRRARCAHRRSRSRRDSFAPRYRTPGPREPAGTGTRVDAATTRWPAPPFLGRSHGWVTTPQRLPNSANCAVAQLN